MSIIGWKQIYNTTLSTAATSITISGLAGDTDICYKLEARIVNGYNGALSFRVRPNNDTGTNYGYQFLDGYGTSPSAGRGATGCWFIAGATALGGVSQGELTIQAKSGCVRTAITNEIDQISGTTVSEVTMYGQSWNNTADEITSLVVMCDHTNGLGIGSEITLYAGAAVLTASTLQSYTESTIKTQGLYSLKGIATTASLNKTLTRTVSPVIDLTGIDEVAFDIYSSRSGANIKIGLHDSGGTTTEITPTITVPSAWQTVTFDLSAVADADKDAIDSITITIVNADFANTFYIDNFGIPAVEIDTVTKIFGVASGYFNGKTNYLSIPDSSDWNFGTGDFTIDFWVRFDSLGSSYLIDKYTDANNRWGIIWSGTAWQIFNYKASSMLINVTQVDSLTLYTWYHVAFVRSGNNWSIFRNGVQLGTPTVNTNAMDQYTSALQIGRYYDGATALQYFNGYLDELRVSKGVARWTEDFTPPASAYSKLVGTFTVVDGLDHLEGRTVSILADGSVITPQVVAGGQITLVNPASLAHVGLGYYADLETLNVELGLPDGTLQGRKVQISRVVLRLDNARGGYLGPDFDYMYELLGDYKTSVSTSLFTGDVKINLSGGYSDGGRFCFRQVDPLPITILGVMPLVTPGQTTGLS